MKHGKLAIATNNKKTNSTRRSYAGFLSFHLVRSPHFFNFIMPRNLPPLQTM